MNLLSNETSPYLLQHKDNPVAWMPWGPAALARARAENKPILLSIGYSACHWCHVMAHESFEDPATAALMNQHFINIKVDREERPDIDTIYQSALALMGKQGGWPLTMFLTPEAAPFWGGTYFPPQPRYGMPSFREILRGVAEAFEKDTDKIEHNVKSLAAALGKMNTSQNGSLLHREALDKAGRYFLGLIDPAHGGIGNAPKFPNLPIIRFLWASYVRTDEDAYKAAVIHSLIQMCQGGIYDHIGGGFSRYTVDAEWLVPHFEKMLYDNAQFVALLAEVYKETQNPLFAARITETVEWLRRDLAVSHGSQTAFATALDADSEGEEGKYYVWTHEEVESILGAEAEHFAKVYDVTRFGNWENNNILNRLKTPEPGTAEEEERLRSLCGKLRAAREKRVPPGRDDKVLADINGLAVTALVRAGEALQEPAWIESAASAFGFIATHMSDNGRLSHSWCAGKAQHGGLLDDYANMAEAALALFQATQDSAYLAQAERFVGVLDRDFHDAVNGGYFMTPAALSDVLVRPKTAHDGAVPAGNSTLVGVLARLWLLTGTEAYAVRARETAEAFSGELAHHIFPFSTLAANSDLLLNPVSVVIAGDEAPFRAALEKISLPGLVKTVLTPGMTLPPSHPAFGKAAIAGKAAAYVCFGTHCLPPVTTAEDLITLLRSERSRRHAANDG